MRELIPFIIPMSISGIIFMSISLKFGWSKKIWKLINRRINRHLNMAIWIIFAGILNIIIQVLFEMFGLCYNKIIPGIVLGAYFAIMPTLEK